MFTVTNTEIKNMDIYWEIKAQHEMSADDLTQKDIELNGEKYVTGNANWGETHTNPSYNQEIYNMFNGIKPLFILDIGCGGGGFIEQCVIDGHHAVGIDIGIGYAKTKSYSWSSIPNNLFVRDFGQPINITFNKEPVKFDFIHSWDVFEHIFDNDLDQVCNNIKNMCKNGTYIMLKIADWPCQAHRTIKSPEEWLNIFKKYNIIQSSKIMHHTLREKEHGFLLYLEYRE